MSYNVATFARLDTNSDGRPAIVLRYTGNAGETPIEVPYPVDVQTMPTADYMRAIAMARIAVLNNSVSFIAGATPNIGAVLDTTTPLPTPPAVVFGSYIAVATGFTPGATPQDVFTITGSATRTVNITGCRVVTTQTTAGNNAWLALRRSTANTGGTSAALTPLITSGPAATAVVRQYTANPTAGTLVAPYWAGRVCSPAAATSLGGPIGEELISARDVVTLTGTGDVFSVNFNGVALPTGLSVQVVLRWNESSGG